MAGGIFGRRIGARLSAEGEFWQWFKGESTRIFSFEREPNRILAGLSNRLRQIDSNLTFQIGPIEHSVRELVLSADGIADSIPAVQRLVSSAPNLPSWKVVAFRQRTSGLEVIEYQGIQLDPRELWFSAVAHMDLVDLQVYIPGYTGEDDPRVGASFIILDNLLGEYAVMTRVGVIAWYPLHRNPSESNLIPASALAQTFDKLVGHISAS